MLSFACTAQPAADFRDVDPIHPPHVREGACGPTRLHPGLAARQVDGRKEKLFLDPAPATADGPPTDVRVATMFRRPAQRLISAYLDNYHAWGLPARERACPSRPG